MIKEDSVLEKSETVKKEYNKEIKSIGKALVTLSGFMGLISMLFFYVLPDIFYLWHIEVIGYRDIKLVFGGFSSGGYTTRGGTISIYSIRFFEESSIMILVGLLMILGTLIAFAGTRKSSKGVGILGGILLLLAPILFMGTLLSGGDIFGDLADAVGLIGQNLVSGSISDLGITVKWGIGAGTILPLIGGCLGILGGALGVYDEKKQEHRF